MSDTTKNPSLKVRLFRTLLILAITIVTLVVVVVGLLLQDSIVSRAQSALAVESDVLVHEMDLVFAVNPGDANLVAEAIRIEEAEVLSAFNTDEVRLTLIAPDGTVLFDSVADPATMDNHFDRPEVQRALEGEIGESVRSSETAGYVSIYRAVLLSSGDVLRLSLDWSGVGVTLIHDGWLLAVVIVITIVFSWFAAHMLTEHIMAPIVEIDPTDPHVSEHVIYREFQPLVRRLAEQQETLHEQMVELKNTDAIRQEFTANVTHELKTPVATISAAAELIRDGIALPADIPGFADRICREAARLSNLVSDILMLSKLDESERRGDHMLLGSSEPCDLLAVCRDVSERMAESARRAGIRVIVEGEPITLEGNAKLLDEMIHNLCDNSIRYGREGGTVRMSVARLDDGRCLVRVADNGQGIPKGEQTKVFERFYRVEASRSRELGGTGLGLAIVKHAAAFHGAEIEVESQVDVGTTITVTFPALAASHFVLDEDPQA